MQTRQELIERTLKLLNVLAAGQSPEPEDVETVDKYIDGLIDELSDNGTIYSSDKQQFEDKFIDPLATILGDVAAPDFGQGRDRERWLTAVQRLQSMKPNTYVTYSAQQTDYF